MNALMETPLKVTEVVLACFVAAGKGEPVHKNRPSHGLVLLLNRRRFVFDGGRTVHVKAGDLLYLPKGCSYVAHDDEKTEGCYAINFQLADAPEIPVFVHGTKQTERFLEAFRTAEAAWKAKRTGGYERCAQALYGILSDLKEEMNAEYLPKSRTLLIDPALRYINERYTVENISVPHLASLCGISEVYLRKIFRSAFGVSPLRYVNGLKLARAKELIRSGECSVGEAAAMSGFFDDSYFSREFKKTYGVSPRELLPGEGRTVPANEYKNEYGKENGEKG